MSNPFKIIILWSLILLGFIFHSLLATMPLFFGESITTPDATGTMPEWMNWMALAIYMIPMLMITVTLYTAAKWHTVTNLILAVLFVGINAMHLFEEFGNSGIQTVLLSFILILSLLLILSSYRWFRE